MSSPTPMPLWEPSSTPSGEGSTRTCSAPMGAGLVSVRDATSRWPNIVAARFSTNSPPTPTLPHDGGRGLAVKGPTVHA
jgi:hypothetical protein